ncbi:hypothetical protein M405DRAFT_803890 [Rhizopogon salebrosus TDB-379]|nr:hypothetical protein M405DRAFT_803890 [Rhizopogon salebrosus TDB-379]
MYGTLVQGNEVTKRQRPAAPIQAPQEAVADEKLALAEPKLASDMTSPRQACRKTRLQLRPRLQTL